MQVAISTIYGELYTEDRLFDSKSCSIGENLLMPTILLKEHLEQKGHSVHTVDMMKDYDVIIFQEIPKDSWLTIETLPDRIKYILKKKWKKDYLYKAVRGKLREKIILQINEPPTVAPQSYEAKYHKYFGKVMTWNDDLVDGEKYIKFYIPQYWDGEIYSESFSAKKDFVVIAGNKKSVHSNELYSKRREVIDYFEAHPERQFDLFGFGWQQEGLRNYRGTIERKLETLSKYKYCCCFENIAGINGYVTEKMFDCLFAGCVPIYLGAENVAEYIPKDVFIDAREFEDVEKLIERVEKLSEEEYQGYLNNAKHFLEGKGFQETFATDKYIEIMEWAITN